MNKSIINAITSTGKDNKEYKQNKGTSISPFVLACTGQRVENVYVGNKVRTEERQVDLRAQTQRFKKPIIRQR